MRVPSSVVAVALGLGVVTGAAAQPFEPEVTNGEFSCMRHTSQESAKYVKKRLACVVRCTKNFWRGHVPASECTAPYAGKTLECMARAEEPLVDAITCNSASCPECYENGDCSAFGGEATTRPPELAAFIDQFVGGFFCELADATRPEQSCERKTTKELAKMVVDIGYCADACILRARRGLTPFSECTTSSTSEVATCIDQRIARRILRIDKTCAEAMADPTFCFGGQYPTGAAWANLAKIGFVSYYSLDAYCDS